MSAVTTEGDFIGYRASALRAMNRAEQNDETLEICAFCECEIDVDTPIHRPRCRGTGAPRTNSATIVSAPIDRKTATPAKKLPPRVEPDGLELLERMDAGLPLNDEDDELDEEPALEEVAVGSRGDVAATSSIALRKRGPVAKWSQESALAAGVAFARANGKVPASGDAKKGSGLPFRVTVYSLFGKWSVYKDAIIAELGDEVPATNRRTVPEREPETDGQALEAAAPNEDRVTPPVSAEPPAAAKPSRSDTAGWITVPGTGLKYRNPDEAYVAAVEIEADGARVATACREDGNNERADEAVDQAHELAEKIRLAARAAEERASGSSTSTEVAKPEADPEPPVLEPALLEVPEGRPVDVRLLVSPAEMDGLQRALALAAIAGARAFADTLEQELAA